MKHARIAVVAAAILGFGVGASAQTSTPAPKTDLGSKPGTLGDKLSDTDGVIKPSGDVDPQMHKAAPQTGSMPVIEPDAVAPGTAK